MGTGFIAGQVIETPGGRPVAEATVILTGRPRVPGGPPEFRAQPLVTDSQGRFVFGNLSAGTYTVQASRSGYGIPSALPTDLADGERVLDARVRLTKLATLSGTLRDESGDPVVGTEVIAFRRSTFNGRPSMSPSTRSRSDDRGAYRLANLFPGDYVICACGRDPIPFDGVLLTTMASEPLQLMSVAAKALTLGSDAVSLDHTLRTYPPTFHQNSQSLTRATRVTLAAGEDRTGIDINVELVRATRVSGQIVGAPGPINASAIRLVPAIDADSGYEFLALPPMLVQPDGRFDFATVPPGQYRLFASYLGSSGRAAGPSGAALNFLGNRGAAPPAPPPPPPPPPAPGAAPPPSEPVLWASELVTVGDEGLSGLIVTLRPSLKVTGRMEFVGAAPQPNPQVTARLTFIFEPMSLDRGPTSGVSLARLNPDFSINVGAGLMPGRYLINPLGPPGYTSLKSITVGGVDITDMALEVGERDLNELVITFVDTPLASLSVSVTVAMPTARSFDDVVALVFPADRRYWTDPAPARRRFRTVPVNAKGIATMADLPAGEYFVATGTTQDGSNWQEQTRLDALSRRAQRATLTDGARATVEVRR